MGNNTVASQLLVAGTSTLWISTTITKHVEGTAASDCSETVAGTLLLFMFTKKALMAMNFDNELVLVYHPQ